MVIGALGGVWGLFEVGWVAGWIGVGIVERMGRGSETGREL